ncbi:hypothetical protein TWF281_006436 [Arthrobotrys megalospora]
MELPALGEAVEAFEGASQKQRSHFIDALFASLRPSEKYALHAKLLQDNYFFDIFGSLPIEISLQIAERLDPKEIVLLRQVSSRWKSILSSKQLARDLIRVYYSSRSDFPYYANQFRQDPFSALRNLAFREYAGQTGLFRLKTIYNLSSKIINQNCFFGFLGCSDNLQYVVFENLRQCSLPTTSQLYLIDIKNYPPQGVISLINKHREALDPELIHVSSHCIAGVTFTSGRVLVWNMRGESVRNFRLMHEGTISMASSEKYFCIRDEYTRSEYSDYYLLNLQTTVLQVFERVPDFIKSTAATHGQAVLATPAMKILDPSNRIVLAADVAGRGEVAVSWMAFNEEERTFHEIIGKFIPFRLPDGVPNIPRPVTFKYGTNTSILDISNGRTRNIYLEAAILSDTEISVELGEFDPNFCGRVPSGLSYVTLKPFRYGSALYTVVGSTTKDLYVEGGHSNKYQLWCSRGDQPTPLGPGRLLDLAGMGGTLQTLGVSDEGFLLFFDEGLLLYEWLDFDEFMELQKRTST